MRNASKFLSQNSVTDPFEVNRLIVSAFLSLNNLLPSHNRLLISNTIDENDSDEQERLCRFIEVIKSETLFFGFEELINLFEFVISPADRIVNGAIYTPSYIREFIVNESFKRSGEIDETFKVSDIACGCGGFLYNAALLLKTKTNRSFAQIYRNHIFGLDIQTYSVQRTKILLSLLALINGEDDYEYDFNIFEGDTLDFDWNHILEEFQGFNLILGNPPYVCARNLDSQTKSKLKLWEVCSAGNSDLYIPFFQIGVEWLAENGILGYITMNSFFKSLNGRALRGYFEKKNLNLSIIDFGSEQVFKSKNTYTCICFISNNTRHYVNYKSIKSNELSNDLVFQKIDYAALNSKKGWNLRDNHIISKIEATGVSFGEMYQSRHGIATLKNDVFIFKPVQEDDKYYYLQNGSLFKIEKNICRDVVNSNKLSRRSDIQTLKEKIIFPYDNQQKPKLLDELFFKDTFPEAYNYLEKKKYILATRDKGQGNYENWFAFGRTQSLEKIKNKMFFPKFSDRTPSFIINSDEDLLFYNGLAVVGSTQEEMEILKKIMESTVFWYYIKSTSKPYSSNYYSLNGNYIRNFGICNLSDSERDFVLTETNQTKLNQFFEDKYELKL